MVTFTSRSGSKEAAAKTDQRILLSLYAAGLCCSAAVLILFRGWFVGILRGGPNAEAADMIIPLSITMVMLGLNQAVAMWSLADRTFKIALLYGALGLAYWSTLLIFGRTPKTMLVIMPIGAGASFCVLCVSWFVDRARRK
jgi:hypothetical protein